MSLSGAPEPTVGLNQPELEPESELGDERDHEDRDTHEDAGR